MHVSHVSHCPNELLCQQCMPFLCKFPILNIRSMLPQPRCRTNCSHVLETGPSFHSRPGVFHCRRTRYCKRSFPPTAQVLQHHCVSLQLGVQPIVLPIEGPPPPLAVCLHWAVAGWGRSQVHMARSCVHCSSSRESPVHLPDHARCCPLPHTLAAACRPPLPTHHCVNMWSGIDS